MAHSRRSVLQRTCRPHLLAACGLLLVLAACGSGKVRDDGPVSFQQFEAADADHDGKLDREEVNAIPELAPYFSRMDTDRSGYLSWSEVRAGRFPVYRMPMPPGQRGE